MLGSLPTGGAVSWIPVFPPSVSQPVPVMSPAVVSGMQPAIPSVGCVATPFVGSHCGEGLLPVPEKLTQKIIRLEFVEMRDLMPETWLMEEEDSRKNTLSFPRKRAAPVTDILQWLQCFAAMVGVLSRAYPTMVPEFMSYQATIIKCARDFHGPAWAQYDRAYRRQVAQTKDLRWSRLNPTLYSLCFAGKAKRLVVCAHCLSDSHATDQCPENLDLGAALMSWQQGATNPATPVGGSSANPKAKLCFLFNAKEGPRCTFNPCKYAHRCTSCKGPHPRSACKRTVSGGGQESSESGGGRSFKRPRSE